MSTEIKHSNIDILKMEYQETYSETLFGIPHAPDHQCPEIDKVIKSILAIEKLIKNPHRLDEEELRSVVDDVERELWGLEGDIENIRSACEGIREWGQGWKDQLKRIVNETDVDVRQFI